MKLGLALFVAIVVLAVSYIKARLIDRPKVKLRQYRHGRIEDVD